jgi:hypothetical protein
MESQIMTKLHTVIGALALTLSAGANAYDTGQLTCQNVGQLAAQTLLAKQSGIPYGAYLTALDEKMPTDAQVERQLAGNITAVIYQNSLMDQMRPDDAYAVFVQDCVDGQQRDQMQGDQQDRDDDSADSNEEEQ